MLDPSCLPQSKNLQQSKKYSDALENKKREEISRSDKLNHFYFYLWILFFVVINYFLSSCEFCIGIFNFRGFKDWSGTFSLLILELVFLFIFGTRMGIDHIALLIEKITSVTGVGKK